MFGSRTVLVDAMNADTGLADPAASVAMVTVSDVKTFLKINPLDVSEDAYIELAISVCTDAIERYCDRIFIQRIVTEIIFDHPSGSLVLVHSPVLSVTSIATEAATISPASYVLDRQAAMLRPMPNQLVAQSVSTSLSEYALGTFESAIITAVYVAGYPLAAIPAAIRMACLEYVKTMRSQRSRDPNIAIESVPDVGSRTFVWGIRGGSATDPAAHISGMPSTVTDLINSYRRRV